jgi:hypothetical protein
MCEVEICRADLLEALDIGPARKSDRLLWAGSARPRSAASLIIEMLSHREDTLCLLQRTLHSGDELQWCRPLTSVYIA